MQTSKVFKLLWNIKIAPSALMHCMKAIVRQTPNQGQLS